MDVAVAQALFDARNPWHSLDVMFGPRYEQWARDLVRARPRLAGLYLMALGAACSGVLLLVFRFTGMGFLSMVPLACLLLGAWMAAFGHFAKGPASPWWYRQGALAMLALAVFGAFTAGHWLPLVLR